MYRIVFLKFYKPSAVRGKDRGPYTSSRLRRHRRSKTIRGRRPTEVRGEFRKENTGVGGGPGM